MTATGDPTGFTTEIMSGVRYSRVGALVVNSREWADLIANMTTSEAIAMRSSVASVARLSDLDEQTRERVAPIFAKYARQIP